MTPLFKTIALALGVFSLFWCICNAQTPAASPSATIPPEIQAAMKEMLKKHPDLKLIQEWTVELFHDELKTHDHSARDKLVLYARTISHDEMARASAVNSISAIKSEENLKLTASFLADPSIDVRCRAYYQLPREIQVGIEKIFGDYDYTRPHTEEDFKDEMAYVYSLIEDYTKKKTPKLNR